LRSVQRGTAAQRSRLPSRSAASTTNRSSHRDRREAEIWLLEKATEAAVIDRKRFQTILIWAIIAGVLAAIAAWIAAWPVIKEWIR
jgi:hypothetical protein